MSVVVPIVVPLMRMLMPGRGVPSLEVSVPEIVRDCPNDESAKTRKAITVKSIRIGKVVYLSL